MASFVETDTFETSRIIAQPDATLRRRSKRTKQPARTCSGSFHEASRPRLPARESSYFATSRTSPRCFTTSRTRSTSAPTRNSHQNAPRRPLPPSTRRRTVRRHAVAIQRPRRAKDVHLAPGHCHQPSRIRPRPGTDAHATLARRATVFFTADPKNRCNNTRRPAPRGIFRRWWPGGIV